MVRNHNTIEKKLREINKKIFRFLNGSFWARRHYKKEIQELQIESRALAWSLNKIDRDPRGNRYHAKK